MSPDAGPAADASGGAPGAAPEDAGARALRGRHVRRATAAEHDPVRAVARLQAGLGPGPFALVLVFVSPDRDRDATAAALQGAFGGAPVIGCTTAGEIGEGGYLGGAMVAAGLAAEDFAASLRFVPDLERYRLEQGKGVVADLRAGLAGRGEGWGAEFALMLADGLAMKEDALVSSIGSALGDVPLLGGSAGDALDFRATFVLHGGRFHSDAAVAALVRTRCAVRVFRFDNFRPTGRRMVVTEADPARRLVREINAEPAAREYARLTGKDPDQLSPFTFAAHPVLVKVGGEHHVRSIQKIEAGGELRFYSAIDEGLVLTVAEAMDMAEHLEDALAGLDRPAPPDAVIAFDCILRRLDAEQTQSVARVSDILRRRGVVGFNSYGEQFGMLHVNQTFTGVAIYPPPPDGAEGAA